MNIERIKAVGFGLSEPMGKFLKIDFTRRPVGENDILIDIMYAGICHSDIHVARGEWGKWHDNRMIPGHEIVGIVKEVGSEVSKFKVGDFAAIGCMVDSCGECPNCKRGIEQYCEEGSVLTYDAVDYKHHDEITKGGYSTSYVLNENFAIKIPKSAANKLEKIPSLCCAGITTYSPISRANVEGKSCAVIGLGGLGHMAVKYLHSFGASEVYAFDSVNKSDYEKELDIVFLTVSDRNISKCKLKFDFIISTVPFDYELDKYLTMVKKGGEFAIVGLPEYDSNKTNFSIKSFVLDFGNVKIYGSQIGGIAKTLECIDYSIKHLIYPDVEIIDPCSHLIDEAYEKVREGKVRFRYVIDMTKLGKTEKFLNGGNVKEISPTERIRVGNKTYDVAIAKTEKQKETGLSEITNLPKNLGMLFVYDEPLSELYYTMADTSIDLDIIFINEDGEVISVNTCQAHDSEPVYEENAQFVLEVNANSGIEEGDELEDFDDDDSEFTDGEKREIQSKGKMLILDENGDVLFKLDGGERIVSRIETRKLIKAALNAYHVDEDSAYKKVGKLIFKILDAQDNRDPEYVQSPD